MDAVGELLADVAASLRPQLSTLSAALTQEMVGEVPGLAEGVLEELLAASVTANVRTALDVFEQGLERASIEAPPAAVEYAHRLAQRGVPISALLRAYRLGQAGFQQRMIRAVSERTRDPDTLVQASLLVSTVVFTYVDRISELVVSAYQGERDRWLRNRGAVRSARVMAVLAGGQVDLDEADGPSAVGSSRAPGPSSPGWRMSHRNRTGSITSNESLPASPSTTAQMARRW